MRRRPPQRGHQQARGQRPDPGDQPSVRHVAPGDPLTRTEPAPWGSEHGIRLSAGADLMMSALRLAAILATPALARGVSLTAQAVERTDNPRRGMLRVTLDPRVVTWDRQYVNGTTWQPLGAPLTGDSVGSAAIPTVARLEQDVRTASGLAGFLASLGKALFSVRQERRTFPITAELGVTDRLAVSLMIPIVRVATRTRLQLSPTGSNLGANPLATRAGADVAYTGFFAQFDDALAQLADSITA